MIKRILLLLLLILLSKDSFAAIAFDNATQAFTNSGGPAAPLTFSHTVNSNSEGLIVVGVVIRSRTLTIDTVTYAGVSLTRVKQIIDGVENATSELWALQGNASGANNVIVTLSANTPCRAIASSWTGVDQTAGYLDTTGGASGTTQNVSNSVTTGSDGSVIIDMLLHENTNASTKGASQTLLFATDEGQWNSGGSYLIKASAGSQAMDWTAGASDIYAQSIAAFKVSGAAPTARRRTLLSG